MYIYIYICVTIRLPPSREEDDEEDDEEEQDQEDLHDEHICLIVWYIFSSCAFLCLICAGPS